MEMKCSKCGGDIEVNVTQFRPNFHGSFHHPPEGGEVDFTIVPCEWCGHEEDHAEIYDRVFERAEQDYDDFLSDGYDEE